MKTFNVNTNDIYMGIDTKIIADGFWQCDIDGKKALINKELINFTLLKIRELELNRHISNEQSEVTLATLFNIINEELTTQEEKNEFFRHYTHYLINVAGNLQGMSITWWQENEDELIHQPLVEFNDSRMWDSVKTHAQTSPSQVTLYVLDIFNNQFGKEENKEQLGYQKKHILV
ncbi:MAG: hypothetical protein RR359_02115 [Bacilli bacterium]